MFISERDLRKNYDSLSTDQLLELWGKGGLTNEAQGILGAILDERGLVHEEQVGKLSNIIEQGEIEKRSLSSSASIGEHVVNLICYPIKWYYKLKMLLNGRPNKPKYISEREACSLFINVTFRQLSRFWHAGMADDIEKTLKVKTRLKTNEVAIFEFAMAFLALQMQTLVHILERERAERMRNFVFECLRAKMDDDIDAVCLIKKYENIISKYPQFDYPAKYHVLPLGNLAEAISIALADAFDYEPTVIQDGKATYNLFELAMLGGTFMLFSVDWNWKKFLESMELVE